MSQLLYISSVRHRYKYHLVSNLSPAQVLLLADNIIVKQLLLDKETNTVGSVCIKHMNNFSEFVKGSKQFTILQCRGVNEIFQQFFNIRRRPPCIIVQWLHRSLCVKTLLGSFNKLVPFLNIANMAKFC